MISPQYIACIGRWTNQFTNHLLTSWDIQVYVDCLVSSHRVWHTDQVYIPYTNAIPTVSFIEHFKKKIHHIPFMVYLSTWIVDFHGKCVTTDIPVPTGFPYGYLFSHIGRLVGSSSRVSPTGLRDPRQRPRGSESCCWEMRQKRSMMHSSMLVTLGRAGRETGCVSISIFS